MSTENVNKYPIGGYAPGGYQRRCITCDGAFLGDKRACQCEPCAIKDKEKFDALSPAEQEALLKKNIEAYNQFILEYRGPNSHCKACEDERAGIKHIKAAKHTCKTKGGQ